MVGLLFPGQGSQYVGMGLDLAEHSALARQTFEEADDALGVPLSRLLWDGPAAELTETRNAQPAILVHAVAVYRLVRERLGPVALAAGHSLGEFSAYVAAGAISFGDAVRAVRLRGELMYEAGRVRPGAMAAVLGLDDAGVERLCADAARGGGACVPANYNSPGQVVVSGDTAAVERAVEAAGEAGARRALRLNVSGAFHSPLMLPAAEGLAQRLAEIEFGPAAFPVVSNVTAAAVAEGAEARRLLLEQLTAPVRWAESVHVLLAAAEQLVELGPGSVLAGLVRRIDRQAKVRSIGSWTEVEDYLTGG